MAWNRNRQMIVDIYTPCHQPLCQPNNTVLCANVIKAKLSFRYAKGKTHPLTIFYMYQINQKAGSDKMKMSKIKQDYLQMRK